MNTLFVYGTLRPGGHPTMSDELARRSSHAGRAHVAGELYYLGLYPGLVLSDNTSGIVCGDVFEILPEWAEETWELLDKYEACAPDDPEPHEYTRRRIEVVRDDGSTLNAWTYVLNRLPAGASLIRGGDYLSWRRPDGP